MKTKNPTVDEIKEAILNQFEISKSEADEFNLYHVYFTPKPKCGDGGMFMTFQVHNDGEVELVDYVAEIALENY